jgi:hypothetical protein
MTTALIHVLLAISLNGNPVSVAQATFPAAQALCVPALGVPDRLWDIADNLVKQGKYQTAARAYYQLFRCDIWAPIFPHVADLGLLGPFDGALREAAGGKFLNATAKLKQIIKALPEFGEARFLMGVFQWSAGLHAEARATWRNTITAPYFAMPPGPPEMPFVVTEGKKFLRWSYSRG